MSTLTVNYKDGSDIPESHCDQCDMRFHLIWNASPLYKHPEYCPFCGVGIDEFVYLYDKDQQ